MDKLISTLFAIETLELTKAALERKCITLSLKIKKTPSLELQGRLDKCLSDHGRIDTQLSRMYSMKCTPEVVSEESADSTSDSDLTEKISLLAS
jgi:hypothetical protein